MGLAELGVPDGGGEIYDLALTHRSFAFEQPEPIPHNERLEFLGDAVLGVVVTDMIFRRFPDLPEGDMARLRASLVNTHALAELARLHGVGEHLKLGKGEEASGGRDKDSLLADAFEALIGAVYLDRGIESLSAHLEPLFGERLVEAERTGAGYDPKTALQELTVRVVGDRPEYRIAAAGPDHDKTFTAEVYVGGTLRGVGRGRSKKEAEQEAAREALATFDPNGGYPEGDVDARAS